MIVSECLHRASCESRVALAVEPAGMADVGYGCHCNYLLHIVLL